MSIYLRFISFIVPIDTIRVKYPGGWERCLRDHAGLLGGRVWFDKHLFQISSMDPAALDQIIRKWSDLRFTVNDCCIVEPLLDESQGGCEWLVFENSSVAHLRGLPPGPVSGVKQFERSLSRRERKTYRMKMRLAARMLYLVGRHNRLLAKVLTERMIRWQSGSIDHI